MSAVAHRHNMPAIHHTAIVPQHLDFLPITVPQAIQLTIVALHSTHMLHMPVIVVHINILFPFSSYSLYSQLLISASSIHA